MAAEPVGIQLDRMQRTVGRTRARREIFAWIAVLAGVVALSFLFAPISAATDIRGRPLQPPSAAYPMGLDAIGMDVMLRVVNAARLDIGVAVVAGAIVFILAYPVALVTGFWTNIGTKAILRLLDVFQSFPAIILALTVVALTGNGIPNLVTASVFVFAPVFVRTVRSAVLSLREETFVEAALAIGVKPIVVVIRHVIPHSIGAALAQTTIAVSRTIILIAGLSFIGVGIQPPQPEWGSMLQNGVAATLNGRWWVTVFPGLAIVVTVMIFDRIGTLVAQLQDRRGDVT